MTGLNENHRRRILTSLQYADKLLEEGLHALAPGSRPLFSGYVQDLSPSDSRWVASYTEKIREQMARLLEKCGVEPPAPATVSSSKLRTCLTSLDVTLEDMYPEKLRGYGKMDSAAARDLSWTLQETRRLVGQLLTFLSESREATAPGSASLNTGPAFTALMDRMCQIIAKHGLVEFLPALNSILRTIQSPRCGIALYGKINSGKSSLINRLLEVDLLPVGITPVAALPIHIVAASEPRLRVSFLDHVEKLPVTRLAEYASERENPANSKRVLALEVSIASGRLHNGFVFIETPGIGCFVASGTDFPGAYLPDSDLALVLIDGNCSLGREDLDILQALKAAEIPSIAMISRCDLLSPEDIHGALTYTRQTLEEHLGSAPEVIPISSMKSWGKGVDAWFEQTLLPLLERSRQNLLESAVRRAQSLRESLLATLEMKASRTTGKRGLSHQAERILRRMDESLAVFQQHWENEIDRISGRTDEILEQAASNLARESTAANPKVGISSDLLCRTVVLAIASRCDPFIQKYQELIGQVRAGIEELRESDHAAGVIVGELPRLSALPLPVISPLEGIMISTPGTTARMNPAASARHFRKELEDKLGARLHQMLEELQPRLSHWFLTRMNAFQQSFRLQTDPLRYRSPSRVSAGTYDNLMEDIACLKSLKDEDVCHASARMRAQAEPKRP